MKYIRYRKHKANTGQGTYESLDLGAGVEWDTEVDGDLPVEDIADSMDESLDVLLDNDVDRALRLPGIIQESHIWDFYKKGD